MSMEYQLLQRTQKRKNEYSYTHIQKWIHIPFSVKTQFWVFLGKKSGVFSVTGPLTRNEQVKHNTYTHH